jgi:predicted type IV restriction endonuclease
LCDVHLGVKELNLPPYAFKLKGTETQTQIFDEVRRKWLVCTPEEWVRQHLVMYLISNGYPSGLIGIEQHLKVNDMRRRADIVVYSKDQKPFLLVECKAPEIKLGQKTLNQAVAYNSTLNVPNVMISNGIQHFIIGKSKEGKPVYLSALPEFPT